MKNADRAVLRSLAEEYRKIAEHAIQDERRNLWRRHNALQKTRPLIYVRGGNAWNKEIITPSMLQCEDPFYRQHEHQLRIAIFNGNLGDDVVYEPWLTQAAVFKHHPAGIWGVDVHATRITETGDAWLSSAPLDDLSALDRLQAPGHIIDETATAEKLGKLQDAVGDIIEVNLDRGPLLRSFTGDVSYWLGSLRGVEKILWDMMDQPKQFHALAAFLRDSILASHEDAERKNDWTLCDHQNQAVPYANELPDPAANSQAVRRDQLWYFMAAQEFASVSPAMHDEFLLQYQIPIAQPFGLTAYGCCEDLTHKIDILRQIPNLRRIAVTPWADLQKCAEQIGDDYVISWRPNPSEMITNGFDPARVTKIIREGMEICRGLHVDITLKDITSVEKQPENVKEWTRIVRDIVADYEG